MKRVNLSNLFRTILRLTSETLVLGGHDLFVWCQGPKPVKTFIIPCNSHRKTEKYLEVDVNFAGGEIFLKLPAGQYLGIV